LDWSPERPAVGGVSRRRPEGVSRRRFVGCPGSASGDASYIVASGDASYNSAPVDRYFAAARLLVRRTPTTHTVVSAARGGVFKHFAADRPPITDAGLIVELADGRIAVSQSHDLTRQADYVSLNDQAVSLVTAGPLHAAGFETATPLKQIVFRTLSLTVGRWRRTLLRRLLQRRLIAGRRACPIRLTRRFEFPATDGSGVSSTLRVTDTIELTDRRTAVRRMSFGTDHQSAYVAASGIYHDSALQPWTDLAEHVETLNRDGIVTIVRNL
jgi:hypothetical protein